METVQICSFKLSEWSYVSVVVCDYAKKQTTLSVTELRLQISDT